LTHLTDKNIRVYYVANLVDRSTMVHRKPCYRSNTSSLRDIRSPLCFHSHSFSVPTAV